MIGKFGMSLVSKMTEEEIESKPEPARMAHAICNLKGILFKLTRKTLFESKALEAR